MVCFQKLAGMPSGTGKSGPHAGWGLDVQEPIQLPASAACEAGENPTTVASVNATHAVRQLTFAIADAQRKTRWSLMFSSPIIFGRLAKHAIPACHGNKFWRGG